MIINFSHEVNYEIELDYESGQEGFKYNTNGDPGLPPESPSIEIYSIKVDSLHGKSIDYWEKLFWSEIYESEEFIEAIDGPY